MEFKFNVNEIFKGSPIVEINQTLIPHGFTGDRRTLWDTVNKVTEVVNAMGDASAAAQGLSKPITTSDRLRNSDQTLYLLVDKDAKDGKGVVTGMLKTGLKSLYVFDRNGQYYQVASPCILDFYVHESRQRTGLGKQLFEHMLQKENIAPAKLAVDRPSNKLLSFLNKHYGLDNGLMQANNYVVFDEFFPQVEEAAAKKTAESASSSPAKFKEAANGLQQNFSLSPYGRYGAPRPVCSMAQIIHNQSAVQSNEPSGLSLNMRPPDNRQSATSVGRQQQLSNTPSQSAQVTENIQPQSVRSTKSIPNQINTTSSKTQVANEAVSQSPYTQQEPTRSSKTTLQGNTGSGVRLDGAGESNAKQEQPRSGIATPVQQSGRSTAQLQNEQMHQNEVAQQVSASYTNPIQNQEHTFVDTPPMEPLQPQPSRPQIASQ